MASAVQAKADPRSLHVCVSPRPMISPTSNTATPPTAAKPFSTFDRTHLLRSSAASLAILCGIVSCHAALAFHAIAAKTLWFDEGASVGIARLDSYNFLR